LADLREIKQDSNEGKTVEEKSGQSESSHCEIQVQEIPGGEIDNFDLAEEKRLVHDLSNGTVFCEMAVAVEHPANLDKPDFRSSIDSFLAFSIQQHDPSQNMRREMVAFGREFKGA
jgi:hypothetical protein